MGSGSSQPPAVAGKKRRHTENIPTHTQTQRRVCTQQSTSAGTEELVIIKCPVVSCGSPQLLVRLLNRTAGRPLIAPGPWGRLSVVLLSDL